jgi:hypothetical protein
MKAVIAACTIGIYILTNAEAQTPTNEAPHNKANTHHPAPSDEILKLEPREAGARYGQALGVALVCYGLRTTSAVDRLPETYTDAGRIAFQQEADKVLAAWRQASSCQAAGGPNSCRLLHEWSCRDAIREIGPGGSKLPGLVVEKHD